MAEREAFFALRPETITNKDPLLPVTEESAPEDVALSIRNYWSVSLIAGPTKVFLQPKQASIQLAQGLRQRAQERQRLGSIPAFLAPCALNLAPPSKSSLFTRLPKKWVAYANLRYKALL